MNEDYNFRVKKKRPEEIYLDVSDYYRDETLKLYATSKSMMKIQERITIRALELLDLSSKNAFILDAGSGPGFASFYLNKLGYRTIALDIIAGFLYFHDLKQLNPILADMCYPPFKSDIFDAIISISALQWIFREKNNKEMRDNLINLFKSFYDILKQNSKLIFQFYPKDDTIMKSIGKIVADNTKFHGSFIIDNPNNPKKRKIFLLLNKD